MREVVNADRKTTPAPQTMQKLLYGLSHDMGAPLRAVVQFSQLLEKRIGKRLDEKERYWLQLIHQNGEKSQSMLDGLLCYSRLDANASDVRRFSLSELVQSVIDIQIQNYLSTAAAYSPAPVVTMVTELPEFEGVLDHWRVFFSSVINNALTYQPTDNPTHIPTVQVRYQQVNGLNQLQIDDNGIGVSETHRAEITRPFMRAHSIEEFPGVGMGLSYCDRIAQLHGGRLHFAESPLGGLRVIYSYPNSS